MYQCCIVGIDLQNQIVRDDQAGILQVSCDEPKAHDSETSPKA